MTFILDPTMPDPIDILFPFAADPWVIFRDGWYYCTFTTGVNIQLRWAKSLAGLSDAEPKIIYKPRRGTPNAEHLWAPEIHWLDDCWYVYYAADDGENETHRMYVIANNSPDPFEKQFVDKGELILPEYKWAIDGTVLNVGEGRYFIWSGWPGEKDGRQDLYICRMLDPMLCDERRVLISKPTLDWERIGSPKVNEGPQVLIRGGFVHCIYSASHSTTDHYCLGRLTARLDSNLLDPRSWTKHPEPVFSGANGIISPGHASFVGSHTDERQGDRDWIIYHCARNLGAGWDRYARAQVFDWKDDVPIFGELASPLGRSH